MLFKIMKELAPLAYDTETVGFTLRLSSLFNLGCFSAKRMVPEVKSNWGQMRFASAAFTYDFNAQPWARPRSRWLKICWQLRAGVSLLSDTARLERG